MKKILSIAALSMLSLSSLLTAPAQAAAGLTASNTFSVDITLTAKCKLSTITPLAFTYTAMDAAAIVTGGAFDLQCTNGLSPSLGLVAGITGTGPGATSVTTTDDKVDLQYSVATPAVTADGKNNTYQLIGSMTANQAGKCAAGGATCSNSGATNKVYTLYVTY